MEYGFAALHLHYLYIWDLRTATGSAWTCVHDGEARTVASGSASACSAAMHGIGQVVESLIGAVPWVGRQRPTRAPQYRPQRPDTR